MGCGAAALPASGFRGAGRWFLATDQAMGTNSDWTATVAEPLLALRNDPEALRTAIGVAVERLGYHGFVYSRRNRLGTGIGSLWQCWGGFPVAWADLSRAHGFAKIEPIRRTVFRTSVPLVWDQGSFAADARCRAYFSAAATFDFCSGVCIAVSIADAEFVDFFDVYSSVKRISHAHGSSILENLPHLWLLGVYGHAALPESALGTPGLRQRGCSVRSFSRGNLARVRRQWLRQ